MLISERIHGLLKEKKMTQVEFSNRTGISQSTISDWRRKGTNPSSDKIMIICEVLEVSPYELLLGTENLKLKEYKQPKQPDFIVVNKDSKEYFLIETYQKMDSEAKTRFEDYMTSLLETN